MVNREQYTCTHIELSVWMVSLFNGILTFVGYLMPKPPLNKDSSGTISWEDKGVHTFPKGICPKVKVIAQLEFELANYDSAGQRFNYYTTRTPPRAVVREETYLLDQSA